jgi:hypothetical protein
MLGVMKSHFCFTGMHIAMMPAIRANVPEPIAPMIQPSLGVNNTKHIRIGNVTAAVSPNLFAAEGFEAFSSGGASNLATGGAYLLSLIIFSFAAKRLD